MVNSCLIIGGNLQGIRVALDLAETGQQVYLVEEGNSLGTDVNLEEEITTTGLSRHDVVPMLLKAISHPRIQVLTGSQLVELKGRAGGFKARVARSPQYIMEEICKGCGVCIDACPVVLDGTHGIDSKERKAIDFASHFSVPFVPNIVKERRAPCVETCPAHINIQGYIALVSKGKFKEAYDLIRETIPFPSICGRVCFHPCEFQCNRSDVDEPIAINNIKRFVSDYVYQEDLLEPPETLKPKGSRVAIIGSGPAGLTAAHDLIRMGYRPTVFEALSKTGGMLRVGIVSYRLPRDILDREINDLVKMGVEIRTNCRIGKDISIEGLFSRGYKAVFMSTGAHGARKLGIEGEKLKGVIDGVTFLREISLKGKYKLEKDIIVIGGGNVALDCARTAKRVGAKTVKVVCLESREEMPSHSWEIEEALEEGIILKPSLGPKRILGKDGRVTGLETLKVKHVFDEEGRFNPAFYEGTEGKVKGNSIIVAIGQVAEDSYIKGVKGVDFDDRGHLEIDRKTLMTTRPGLFAGGDLITGPLSVIEAIASGKRVALSIDRYIRNDKEDMPEWDPVRGGSERKFEVPKGLKKAKRAQPDRLEPRKRVKGFEEVEQTFSAETAVEEASRCLNCGSCSECMECVRVCEILNAVDHDRYAEEVEIKASNVVLAVNSGSSQRDWSSKDKADFYSLLDLELDNKGNPEQPRMWEGSLESSRTGVYVSALPGKKKDYYREMVAASAITSELAERTGRIGRIESIKLIEPAGLDRPERVGLFVCRCGGGISDFVDVDQVASQLAGKNPVVFSGTIDYACSNEGIEEMKSCIQKEGIDSLVLTACSCCSLEQICSNCSHQRVRQKEEVLGRLDLPRERIELVNIREHSAWVHAGDRTAATEKAIQIGAAGLMNLTGREHVSASKVREIGKRVTVIGEGEIACSCAESLISLGFDVLLVMTGRSDSTVDMGSVQDRDISPDRVVIADKITEINGGIGSFSVRYSRNETENQIISDFVVMADDRGEKGKKTGKPTRFSILEPFSDRRRGLFRATGKGKKDKSWNTMVGRALAMRVFVERGPGLLMETSWAPTVDEYWCRGCGTCAEVCPFEACELVGLDRSVDVSRVDALRCRGCELCVLHCPTGAMRSGYFDEKNLDRMLESIMDESNGSSGEGKKVLIFACHWCHYGGAGIGERGHSDYPPGVKLIRMTCTGRIGPNFVLKAFQSGADGVMVMGCPDGDCHYIDGNRDYHEREEIVIDLMETMGVPSSRYRTMWISPDKGEEFIRTVREFVEGLGGKSL